MGRWHLLFGCATACLLLHESNVALCVLQQYQGDRTDCNFFNVYWFQVSAEPEAELTYSQLPKTCTLHRKAWHVNIKYGPAM
mmetsp:Transcript_97044/g.230943  ORF Transcript_97044/g.230943 Transcript_97044/m.230943 type:complete len:82 (+) Transcript_97044:100-345(+)